MKSVKPSLPDAQLTLGGMQAVQPTDRLFFAIFPEPDVAAAIGRLAQDLCRERALRRKPLAAERLHVTLHHLGDYAGLPQAVVTSACEVAKRVEGGAFDVGFDSVSSFSGRSHNRPVVLCGSSGLQAVRAFQRELGECMVAVGLGRFCERKFTPHVTLLYDDHLFEAQFIEPIVWTVHEFRLVHSLLGRGEHRVLGRWLLRPLL